MNVKERKDKVVLDEIYVLKGIAIIGLIIWHTYHTPLPLINKSFSDLLWRIFSEYAMPLFMFASGFLFGFSRKEISSPSDYVHFIKTKFKRLMVPYFAVWAIYVTAEFTAEFLSNFTSLHYHVDRNIWTYILLNPIKGRALHLWFIYQLFIVFLLFPILRKVIHNASVLFLLTWVLWLFPIPGSEIFDFVNLRIFIFFFSFGYFYSHCNFQKINAYATVLCLLALVLFAAFSLNLRSITVQLDAYVVNIDKFNYFMGILKKFLAVACFYLFSVVVKNYKNPLVYALKYLGLYSMVIYLFHHIALGLMRAFFINVLHVGESMHVIASIVVFLSGMILPVLFSKYVIRRFAFLPPLLLGMQKVPQLRNT